MDFDLVTKNARLQGIPLEEIAIFYSNLTLDEKDAMRAEKLITHDTGPGTAIARFQADGTAAFPERATGVHYLAAD